METSGFDFDAIVREYSAPLVRFVERMVGSEDAARDIVQDVFIAFHERLDALNIETSLRAYLYASARNRASNYLQHKRLEHDTAADYSLRGASLAFGSAPATPDVAFERSELRKQLDVAWELVPPRARQVAIMRWEHGLGRAEIAQVLGVSEATVANQIVAAAKVMREYLKGKIEGE